LHGANNGFESLAAVTFNDFKEWHTIINTQIERDADFKSFCINVWNLDKENLQPAVAGGIENVEIARRTDRDARSMYKHDFHRKTFGNEQILSHNVEDNDEYEPKIITNPKLRARTDYPEEVQRESAQDITQRISAKIRARGAAGVDGIATSFRIMDKNKNGSLDYNEVKKAMFDYHIAQDDDEIRAVFELFDTDRSGSITYKEFIRKIVGVMNPMRRSYAEKAFHVLDKHNNGAIELANVKRAYNAKKHPDVASGERTEDEVLCEFLDTFEIHFCERNGLKNKDRKIVMEEWLEYYNSVSCSMDSDEHFIQILCKAYGL